MPTPDQIRIVEDRARPRLMELWWALRPLTSVVRFMQTGAHPDDETSGMLAALAFRDGVNISYACSTRGEGGQNDTGRESGLDLGALRTREMERACDVLGMRMYWHSTHPEDTITDFGFSKNGGETLQRWGRERTILRFAEIIRMERPDVICPTFLDVPGQHGHHRAMTEAAHEVMRAAADPALATNLPPWHVKKLYLPAWSGAGQAYDDDLPPPPATLEIKGTDREEMSGWSWDRIGQQSRAFHRTQGMGRWVPAENRRDWPLHLVETRVEGPDDAIWSGLPRDVSDLADLEGAELIADSLRAAGAAIDRAVEAFPDFDAVAEAASEALAQVMAAREACPVAVTDEVAHRLDSKAVQLAHALRLAFGVEARASVSSAFVDAGGSTRVTVELAGGAAENARIHWDLPQGWSVADDVLTVGEEAARHDPYRAFYDPRAPEAPRAMLRFEAGGLPVEVPLALETEPVVLPAERATMEPAKVLLNTAKPEREFDLRVSDIAPADAEIDLRVPSGWSAERTETGFKVVAPIHPEPGSYEITALANGKPAETARLINHDHVAPTARTRRAVAAVAVFDVQVPPGRVGYIGAGNDRVGHWLEMMGADVSDITNDELASDAALSHYDAIVVGIFAMRFRPGLVDAMPAIHRWTEAGGTLVTLYHRPWDNWDSETIPPRRLEIGQPSLRWRVTDEAASVTQLADHPILAGPNEIGAGDWAGWVKERGLYFAKDWDAAYTPLLSMSDPGEAPLEGSLLVADVGAGRHIHTSLILHHQMENLVPGAFRLMANFIARRA
ncbi:MAG: PIG-L family deacetylase [Paracoccaceae bacterium]|nr:PIG-L family deacetylase [Paracoccaceae bacterium]